MGENMSLSSGIVSEQKGRIATLRARHEALSEKIEKEQSSPAVSDHLLKQLKREKLLIKDTIEREGI